MNFFQWLNPVWRYKQREHYNKLEFLDAQFRAKEQKAHWARMDAKLAERRKTFSEMRGLGNAEFVAEVRRLEESGAVWLHEDSGKRFLNLEIALRALPKDTRYPWRHFEETEPNNSGSPQADRHT